MDKIPDNEKLIASLRQQLRSLSSKCAALEQENALLLYQLDKGQKRIKL